MMKEFQVAVGENLNNMVLYFMETLPAVLKGRI